jgi:vanillate O-demethylase monooxygenase subunit
LFIRNCWYVAAWDHEIPADGLFSRTVIGEPLLLYRQRDGRVVALEDRCCHRQAPLSAGRREGDGVRCGYHGLLFDGLGQCTEIPGLDRVPPHVRVRAYPVVVKNRWVFVWMGEAGRADPALLPDNFSNDHPDWINLPGYLHYDTHYLLICDNLLDFSHLSYVHEKTLGGSTKIAQARPTIEALAQGLRVTRLIEDVPPPAFYKRMRRTIATNLDRWFVYDFVLPGTLLMHSGGRPAGTRGALSGGDPTQPTAESVNLHSCQTLTPETEHTTHYFFQQSCHAEQGDAAIAQSIHESLLVAFDEDRDMITAQARNLAVKPGMPMIPLAMDAALIRFRRLVDERLAAERRP